VPGGYFKNRSVVVLGAARSGLAACAALVRHGAKVALSDRKPLAELAAAAAEAARLNVVLVPGGHPEALLDDCSLIIISPGVSNRIPFVKAARARGIDVWSEIELAWRLKQRRWLAVTGTNGKTTTTSLLHAMFRAAAFPSLLGGNIGEALADRVEDAPDEAAVVAEVSSFQLEDTHEFKPFVGVFTNLTPDHLDRYPNFAAYGEAKARLFRAMDRRDHLVSNAQDPAVEALCAPARAVRWRFARGEEVACGAWEKDGVLWLREPGNAAHVLLPLPELRLRGPHNLENALAAACAAAAFGLPVNALQAALRDFGGVEHRLEACGEVRGIRFVNDSKATNVDSVLKALQSFNEPVHLILGGRDKEGDFSLLAPLVQRSVAGIYSIGEAADKVARQLGAWAPIRSCGTLERAVEAAYAAAKPGEWVLLSPGCASFDQFENYEHRGRVFKACVAGLVKKETRA
jgi:UDP-N-acetylmuramoylalanine--D-glutamate ligase